MKAQRTPIVIGNWKMQGNRKENELRLSELQVKSQTIQGEVRAVLCPAYLHLQQVASELKKTSFLWGAQDVSQFVNGAITGDVSADMLKDMACSYCIIGHSERRGYFKESAQQIADKFIRLSEAGIMPIVCVGESLEIREAGQAESFIVRQINEVADIVSLERLAKSVLAYEPIWAIGTGKTASPQQAQSMHEVIRANLGEFGESTPILYGGSVKADNAASLFAQPDIDGALVGGASLDASSFIDIVSAAQDASADACSVRQFS